jgi:hypothetical protein
MKDQTLKALQEPWTTRSFATLVIVALVVPGGSLVFAWALLRRFLGRAALARIAQVLVLALGLQACATRIDLPDDPALHFQIPDSPVARGRLLTTKDLRPGDIVLTSMPGMVGASIELLTLAPVSHAAIYEGDGRIVEALRPAVRERTIDTVMVEESEALVLRHPGLTDAQAERVVAYAKGRLGSDFNYVGVTLQTPVVLARRACELPLVPGVVRDACIRTLGVLNPLAGSDERLFCSQLVLEAYRHAGVPLADADPTILTPADILHMREGDVPSFRIATPLHYVGHLKNTRTPLAAVQLRARGD